MSKMARELLAIYVDGETKTGKGAASKAIAGALRNENLPVYYDVAGNFYRRYVALVRKQLGLSDSEPLPRGTALEVAAQTVYEAKQMFEPDESLGDLQRPAISQSVSVLGELPLAQKAGAEWWAMVLRLAHKSGAGVLVLDGRNPRSRVKDAVATTGIPVRTALDLYMTCDAVEAGRRALSIEGITSPSRSQLQTASQNVVQRRSRDRERPDYPLVVPAPALLYDPKRMAAEQIVEQSWKMEAANPPTTITLDNTRLTKPEMLSAVRELASSAIDYIKQ